MKLIGLSLAQVSGATAAVLTAHHLPTNGIVWVGLPDSGYFKVNAHSSATKALFASSHLGASHYSPCKCFFSELSTQLSNLTGSHHWAIWLHKHKIHGYSSQG